ncbi:MAG: DUF933 domain-containing protein, partial [Candidatus Liptonbacteria bacterium]|nr:DUF933 domain-containing protein [Candidatus Liptonbacteria bacterium]
YSNVLKNIRIRELNLLTGKKQVYLLNGDEADVPGALKDKIGEMGGGYVVANLAAAGEISELIRKAYEILDLISFFTTGEDETRAWTIEKDMKAPQAAGVIHSDFEKNFIRAEVISCDQLLQAGSWSAAKAKGWIRLEGRDYIVQDGDVIVVRHG